MTERPAPSAEGSLAKTPFAHVLLYVRDRQLDGTIAIDAASDEPELNGESLLAFEKGALTQVKLPSVVDPLGVVLREMGAIDDGQLEESLDRLAQRQGLQGDILVAIDACSVEAVERALRIQVKRKAHRLFAVNDGPYKYFANVDLLASYGRERYPEDLLSILWRGVRAHPEARAIDAVLAKVGTQHLKLRNSRELRLFEFDRAESAVLDVLRTESASVEQLLRAGCEPRIARAMMYALVITKQVELAAPGAPRVASAPHARVAEPAAGATAQPPRAAAANPGESTFRNMASMRTSLSQGESQPPARPSVRLAGSAPVVATGPVSPEIAAKIAEAEARFTAMQDETYFQMLGIETSASLESVRAAFLAKAATWHPDRVPANAPSMLEVYARVFALLNDAQATLADENGRGRYIKTVHEGGGTPNSQRKIGLLIEAATDAQKAEICLKRREYDEAERLCRRSLAVSPEDPNSLAILAMVLMERRVDGPTEESIQLLSKAVEIAPKHDRAHVLLGSIYKRKGETARAAKHFKLAQTANPKNMDAQREVRLAEMRADEAKPATGLFSKFLKK